MNQDYNMDATFFNKNYAELFGFVGRNVVAFMIPYC